MSRDGVSAEGEVFAIHEIGPHMRAGLIGGGSLKGQRMVLSVDGEKSVLVDIPVTAGMAKALRGLADTVERLEPPAPDWPPLG